MEARRLVLFTIMGMFLISGWASLPAGTADGGDHPLTALGPDGHPEGMSLHDIGASPEVDLNEILSVDVDYGSPTVSWRPDGNYLGIGGGDRYYTVDEFNGTSLTFVDSTQFRGWALLESSWAPNGKHVALTGPGPAIYAPRFQVVAFDGSYLSPLHAGWRDMWYKGDALAWSPDGDYLAVGGSYGSWSKPRWGVLEIFPFDGSWVGQNVSTTIGAHVYSVDWHPDGRYLAVGADNGASDVVILDLRGAATVVASRSFGAGPSTVRWSPDGDHLAVVGANGLSDVEVLSWNGSSLSLVDTKDFGVSAHSVAWMESGHHLVVGGDNGDDDVALYSFNGTDLVQLRTMEHGSNAVSVDTNGKYIAVGGDNDPEDVRVYRMNLWPVANDDDNITLFEDTDILIDVVENDHDMDDDPLAVVNITQPSNGTATISGDGRSIHFVPDPDWFGETSLTYNITDGFGGSANATVNITVVGVNDMPIITTPDLYFAQEDTEYSVDYDAIDADPDDVLTWGLQTIADFLSMDSGTGLLTGMPTNGDVGVHYVVVNVTDGSGGEDVRIFTVTVANVNDPPVISTEALVPAVEDEVYDVLLEVVDVDRPGDLLTWRLDTDADWLTLKGDTLTGLPGNDDVGTYWVNISVSDGKGGEDGANLTLAVENVNDPPSIVTVPTVVVAEDQEHSQSFEAEDVDAGSSLTWSFMGPSWLTMDEDTGILTGTPSNAEVGNHWMMVTVSDGLEEDSMTFMLTVENVNDPPEWVIRATDQELMEGDVLFMDVRARDVDGDALLYDLVSTPASGISISADIGAIRWLEAEPGNYTVKVTATDGTETITHEFTVTVEAEPGPPVPPANKVPVIEEVGAVNVTAGEPFILTLVGSDEDEWDTVNLTFTLVNGPEDMMVSSDGIIIWLPGEDTVGVRFVTVELTDGKGKATLDFEVEVLEAVVDDGDTSGVEDGGDYLWLVVALAVVVALLVAIMLWMYMGQRETPMVDTAQKDVEVEDDDLENDESEDNG